MGRGGYKLVPESLSKTLQLVFRERCCNAVDRRDTVLAACCDCLKAPNGGASNSARDMGARSGGAPTSRGDKEPCRRPNSPPCIAGRQSPLLEGTITEFTKQSAH